MSERFMIVPPDPPRPKMITIREKYEEWQRETRTVETAAEELYTFRHSFYFGASSALTCLLKGTQPHVFDGAKFTMTFMEMMAYAQPELSLNTADPRETTLTREWLAGDCPKSVDHRDAFYAGARALMEILLDRSAFRVDVRKLPFLLREIHEYVETRLPRET